MSFGQLLHKSYFRAPKIIHLRKLDKIHPNFDAGGWLKTEKFVSLGAIVRKHIINPSKNVKKRIAIFASGSGSNAQKIMEYFKYNDQIEVALVLSNNPDAYVLQRADNFEVPTHIFDRHAFYKTDEVVDVLERLHIDLVVLAGFLWLIPQNLLRKYPNKIINIHPALLPAYGGKGMYGDRVHQAILDAGDEESGITIHFVNEHFDEGEVIYQARFHIQPDDSLEVIKFKGQQLEHLHYPKIIENLLKKI